VVQKLPHLGDHRACRLGRFLREHHLEGTSLAAAHQAYHTALVHGDEAALTRARGALTTAMRELKRGNPTTQNTSLS
jgi:cell division protein ZapA (FtsZ GTPase activity inhibitor)